MLRPWPLLESRQVFDTGLFQVRCDCAQSPRTGKSCDLHVIQMVDWLMVVPLDSAGRLVMVRQYRHAARDFSLEVPGGLHDDEESTSGRQDGAKRELMEETGYGGGAWHFLGQLRPQPALLANRVWIYLAEDVRPMGTQNLDPGEDIDIVLVEPRQLSERIASGEINNAMTVAALFLAQQSGHL